jgi:hypothetical protein
MDTLTLGILEKAWAREAVAAKVAAKVARVGKVVLVAKVARVAKVEARARKTAVNPVANPMTMVRCFVLT